MAVQPTGERRSRRQGCTDGLVEPVPDDQIARVLAEQLDPQDAARSLLQLALEGGGPDNVTVVVARYQVDR
jgi:protein phosphatase